MVSFDHRDPGTSESEWTSWGGWDAVPDWVPRGFVSALVISAHPDDETLGAGGLIQMLADEGVHLRFVLATDGEAAHPEAPQKLSVQRRSEYRAALESLAPDASVNCLGLPDGGLRDARAALRTQLQTIRGGLIAPVLIIAPWHGDGHRDHRIAGSVAAELANEHGDVLLEYPIWLWHWGRPEVGDAPWRAFVAHPLSDSRRAVKRRALEKFGSQVAGINPILHERMLEHFARDRELFVVEGARA